MLSQAELFHRLPVSEEQKKELYFQILNESRKGQTHPGDSSHTPVASDCHSEADHQEHPLEAEVETQQETESAELSETPCNCPEEGCQMQID